MTLYNHHHGAHGPNDPTETCIYIATPAEIVAAVRRGVESGTIEGEEGWWCLTHLNGVVQRDTFPPDTCWSFNADADSCLLVDATVVVGPVSDGGSET